MGAYADAAEAPDPLSTEEGSATWAQIQDYIKDATPEEKEMAEWVPVPEPFCPKTYFYNMKRYLACRSAGFLSNREFRPFLRVTDCSQVSDGGAAAIFMSE